ncbi:MAG: hypothetical protein HGA71_03980 [Azonexaceae bacterium]|nr:hypothetical protein [Azonexaceae bacterium]
MLDLLHLVADQKNPAEDSHLALIKTKQAGPLGKGYAGPGRRRRVGQRATDDLLPEGVRNGIRGALRTFANGQDIVVVDEVARVGRTDVGADQTAEQIDLMTNRTHERHGVLAMPCRHLGVFVRRQGAQGGTGDQGEHPGERDQYAEKGFPQVHLTKTQQGITIPLQKTRSTGNDD